MSGVYNPLFTQFYCTMEQNRTYYEKRGGGEMKGVGGHRDTESKSTHI